MCFKRSVTSLCTVDLLMPNFAAVCRTVFLLSAIYSPSLTARSHAFPFKKDSSFSLDVVLCIWRMKKFILSLDCGWNFVRIFTNEARELSKKQLTLYDEKYIIVMAYFYYE